MKTIMVDLVGMKDGEISKEWGVRHYFYDVSSGGGSRKV